LIKYLILLNYFFKKDQIEAVGTASNLGFCRDIRVLPSYCKPMIGHPNCRLKVLRATPQGDKIGANSPFLWRILTLSQQRLNHEFNSTPLLALILLLASQMGTRTQKSALSVSAGEYPGGRASDRRV
jgi:hypothetical protein